MEWWRGGEVERWSGLFVSAAAEGCGEFISRRG